MIQWIAKNIFIVITMLIALQLFLIWLNVDVVMTIEVVNNISWWLVFIPLYVVIFYILFMWFIFSALKM